MKVKPNNYIAIEFPSRSVNEGLARAAVAALAAQLDLGKGSGPINHLYKLPNTQ